MKDMLYVIASMVVILPCLLIFNESDTFVPNVIGFIWCFILIIISKTKVGNDAIKKIERVNKQVEKWLCNK